MSERVAEAEQRLALCLEAMRDALQLTVEDALTQSTLGGLSGGGHGEATVPDTLRQRLEEERGLEARRVGRLAHEARLRVELLRRSIVALGGGSADQPSPATGAPVVDIPILVLDGEIERLAAENGRLGNLMVERYAEAQELARVIEAEITSAVVPPL